VDLTVTPPDTISSKQRQARQKLREIHRTAVAKCKEHLNTMIQAARATKNKARKQLILGMKQAEENHWCFSTVWQMLNLTTPGGLTQLIVPTSDAAAPWITIHDKEMMEQHLIQHSREHFSQAHGTPFTQPPLTSLLNFDGVTPFGNTIFAGRPIPPELAIAPATCLLLQHQCILIPKTENTDHPLDFDLLMQGFRKWPEKTTTSPSG